MLKAMSKWMWKSYALCMAKFIISNLHPEGYLPSGCSFIGVLERNKQWTKAANIRKRPNLPKFNTRKKFFIPLCFMHFLSGEDEW